ncbi:coiled-coil domain-containing protein SCD2 isoform X2 [Zea mays]|uniref:Coiled-coil domain-containing protein SCD2 n=1 Tax=Zea mays TaxID=4577 RepID=A0A804RHM5_MAIZE|nr:coiled-coil domain-containing protein SCD2 isoform X2 [Zea mays]|eukprot:XP_008662961.3 coiled-coil domain-containing protein SCD2 isoform X2 [Zea mays]
MDRLARPASPGGGGLGYASRRGLYAQASSHHLAGGSAQTSPGGSPKELSPVHRHARAGSLGGAGAASTAGRRAGVGAGAGARAQNSAARAAAQRLARVMGGAGGDAGSGSDDDDDYELSGPPIELSNTPRRTSTRSPSPSVGRHLADQTQVGRPPSLTNRYTAGKSVPMIPSIKRPATSGPGAGAGSESPMPNRREQRRSVDLGSSLRARRTSSSLNDEINTLQVENESMYDKLAEERFDDGDAKSMHMEREDSDAGDAAETEPILINRKDAALEQRKIAMRIASRRSSSASCNEIATLKSEAKVTTNVVTSLSRRVKSARSELRSLQATANRMILSQEELEEVVLKRCWLARYWTLCSKLGIHSDIAEEKKEYWSSFAPLALEAVLSIGQKARDGTLSDNADMESRSKMSDVNDISTDGNIETMLSVEKGLRELASLKVEDAIMLTLAENRHVKPLSGQASEGRSPSESLELSAEEREDVRFKQAWLTYFWRRAKNHNIEEDIADEKLQFWIEQINYPVTTSEVVEVERGLHELKKLGIESQLWEATRRALDDDLSNHGSPTGSEA